MLVCTYICSRVKPHAWPFVQRLDLYRYQWRNDPSKLAEGERYVYGKKGAALFA